MSDEVVTLRRSHVADAETVFSLTAAAVARLAPEFYPQNVVDSWMTGRTSAVYSEPCAAGAMWLAETPSGAVGFCHAVKGEVIRLFVDAKCQGTGLGALLMERALLEAIPAGGGTVRIEATLNAVPFYGRWGFKEVCRGVFPGRARLPQIDVVHLEADFPADRTRRM